MSAARLSGHLVQPPPHRCSGHLSARAGCGARQDLGKAVENAVGETPLLGRFCSAASWSSPGPRFRPLQHSRVQVTCSSAAITSGSPGFVKLEQPDFRTAHLSLLARPPGIT